MLRVVGVAFSTINCCICKKKSAIIQSLFQRAAKWRTTNFTNAARSFSAQCCKPKAAKDGQNGLICQLLSFTPKSSSWLHRANLNALRCEVKSCSLNSSVTRLASGFGEDKLPPRGHFSLFVKLLTGPAYLKEFIFTVSKSCNINWRYLITFSVL